MKTSHILVLMLVGLVVGLYARPIIESKIFGEKDTLDEDAVYLANLAEDNSRTYKLSGGSEVEIKVRPPRGVWCSALHIVLDDGTCLISEGWDGPLAGGGPSNDAKNLSYVKDDSKIFKRSDFSPEEFKTLSDKYREIIRESAEIERESTKAKIKDIGYKVKNLVSNVKDVN